MNNVLFTSNTFQGVPCCALCPLPILTGHRSDIGVSGKNHSVRQGTKNKCEAGSHSLLKDQRMVEGTCGSEPSFFARHAFWHFFFNSTKVSLRTFLEKCMQHFFSKIPPLSLLELIQNVQPLNISALFERSMGRNSICFGKVIMRTDLCNRKATQKLALGFLFSADPDRATDMTAVGIYQPLALPNSHQWRDYHYKETSAVITQAFRLSVFCNLVAYQM